LPGDGLNALALQIIRQKTHLACPPGPAFQVQAGQVARIDTKRKTLVQIRVIRGKEDVDFRHEFFDCAPHSRWSGTPFGRRTGLRDLAAIRGDLEEEDRNEC